MTKRQQRGRRPLPPARQKPNRIAPSYTDDEVAMITEAAALDFDEPTPWVRKESLKAARLRIQRAREAAQGAPDGR